MGPSVQCCPSLDSGRPSSPPGLGLDYFQSQQCLSLQETLRQEGEFGGPTQSLCHICVGRGWVGREEVRSQEAWRSILSVCLAPLPLGVLSQAPLDSGKGPLAATGGVPNGALRAGTQRTLSRPAAQLPGSRGASDTFAAGKAGSQPWGWHLGSPASLPCSCPWWPLCHSHTFLIGLLPWLLLPGDRPGVQRTVGPQQCVERRACCC